MKLTDTTCRNAKVKDKPYKLADGGGMYLEITPHGSKLWRFKFRVAGKENRASFGKYPEVSLKEAREKRANAKKQLSNGIDPAAARKETKRLAQLNAANTFEAIACEWHESQKVRWSLRHADNVLHRLKADIFPEIGDRPIKDISPPLILEALRKIETRGAHEIARRAMQVCGQVFVMQLRPDGRWATRPAT